MPTIWTSELHEPSPIEACRLYQFFRVRGPARGVHSNPGLAISANQRLTGGSVAEAFVFNTAPGSTNIDTITDFRVIDDEIRIDNAVFTAAGADDTLSAAAFRVGAAAGDANDRIIYNASTGALL